VTAVVVVGDRDGYSYRRHHYRVGGCRTIIVKSWHLGHRVVRRIRRCDQALKPREAEVLMSSSADDLLPLMS
jgi:hypothetical protein